MRKSLFLAVVCFLVLHSVAGAVTRKDIVIQPGPAEAKDAWIGSLVPQRNTGSSDTLLIGRGDPASLPIIIDAPLKTTALQDWRGLLQFDVSGMPPDASQLQSRLYLYLDTFWPLGLGVMKLSTYRLTAPWTEGTGNTGSGATWLLRSPGISWSAAGGDYVWEVGEKRVETADTWLDWDIKQHVQFWAARPDSNFGLLVKRKRDGYALGSFVSSDSPDPALRPKVTIHYESTLLDGLPALLDGAAEVQPNLVPKNSTVLLTLYASIDVNDAYLGMGVSSVTVPMPEGFRNPVVESVTWKGAAAAFQDVSDGTGLAVRLASRLAGDGTLAIRYRVDTPSEADEGGRPFQPFVDDSDTPYPSDAISEGEANGTPGDGDTYFVRVASGPLASIVIAPGGPVVTADSVLVFSAAGFDAEGDPVPISPEWTVAGGIGTIDTNGRFEATRAGSGAVLATAGGITGSTSVTVIHGRAVSLSVSPPDTTLVLGGIADFVATASDADGNAFTPDVSWWATAAIGTIDGAGRFVSRARGKGIVTATAGAVRDTAEVTVRYGALVSLDIDPPSAAVTTDTVLSFQAIITDEAGNDVDTTVAWSVEGGIGAIDGSGVFDARRVGSGSVRAAIGPLEDSAPVSVSFGRPARLRIEPRDSTITAIDSLLFRAFIEDSDSNSTPTTAVLWSEPTGTGTIDPSGLFHAAIAGEARVAASWGGIADTTGLAVVPGPLAALRVVPQTDTLDTEGSIDFDATATDARGNAITDPGPLLWSGASSIGTLDAATGLFTPATPGADSVTVARGSVIGRSGRIEVVPGPTRSVDLEPGSLEIVPGSDTLFTAVSRDGAGNSTGDPISWSVTGGVGTIAAGRFTASSPGTGSVIAAAGSARDTAEVVVYNNTGIRLDAVLENRSAVSRGEQGIDVRLAVTNRTGDALTGIAGSLRFLIGSIDVTTEYAVAAIPFVHEPLPDGASDTLRFLVAVGGAATPGSPVVIDGRVTGILASSGAPAAGLAAVLKGGWIVGEGPLLAEVSRSLYPNKAYAGNRVGFAITLRNTGPASLTADGTTTLSFSDGSAAYSASLIGPVVLAGSGGTGALVFDASVIPGALDPGRYAVTLAVRGVDGNGGAFAQNLVASASPLDLLPPYVLATAEPIDARIVRPGADSVALLRLALVNLYEEPAVLSQVRVTNGNSGPGTTADRDGEWDLIRLVEDRNLDGEWGAGDALLGSGLFSLGVRAFSVSLTLAPGDSTGLLVLGDLSLTRARDGEGLDARIASSSDIAFGSGLQVGASFPLDSPGAHFVDGFVAAQMTAFSAFPSPLPAGAADSLAFDLRVPSNGYLADTLRTITVQNAGTAAALSDLTRLRLWRDGGNGTFDRGTADDTGLGDLYWTGAAWARSGLDLPVPVGGARLFVSVDVSESAADQRTVRLRVPIDGVSMASGNDGPADAPLLSPASRVVGAARRVLVEVTGSASGTVLPGEHDRPLFEVTFTNLYADSIHLEGMAVANASSGAAPDSVARFARLYAGALLEADRPYGTPIASAASRLGLFDLKGFVFSVPPGATRTVTLAADAALRCVSDGDSVAVALLAQSALRFRTSRSVVGAFPLAMPSPPVIDGHVAAQVAVATLPAGVVAPTESGRLALEISVPSNGCLPDTLEGVRVQNLGSASAGDIASLSLYAAGDPETSLGALVWNGQAWLREGISLPVPPGGASVRVRVAPAAGAEDGRTIRLAVPVNGLAFSSSNDGPRDASLVSPTALTISTSPLFASLAASARTVTVGQTFRTWMAVSNADQGEGADTLVSVGPDSLIATGAPLALLASPAADTTVRLAPGGDARFEWVWRAEAAGTVRFAGTASGERSGGGEPVASPLAESDEVWVQRLPSGIHLSPERVLQGPLNRGTRDVRLWVLPLAHADSAGSESAEIRIDTVRIGFRDASGAPIRPDRLLRGATARLGEGVLGTVDSASIGGDLLEIPMDPPLRVAAGGTRSVTLFVDLLEETEVTAFRGVVSAPTALAARDANSLSPVAVLGAAESETDLAAIVIPPANLTVTVTEGLPDRVNRGTDSVPLLGFRLETSGITGVTADLAIGAIRLFLTDGLFPFEAASITGPQGTHFSGSGWDRSGDFLSFPLSPSIQVSVNNPIQVRIEGSVRPDAPLGLFRIGIQDTSFVHPETQSEGSEVEVVLLLTDAIESRVVVPTDSILAACFSAADTSVAHPGDRSREGFRVVFVHPGSDTLSPVSVAGFRTRLENADGDSVEARAVIGQARVYRGASLIASLAPLTEGAATLNVSFLAPLALEPGDSADVRLAWDIRADAPPDDYRFALPAAGIEATDAIGEDAVPVRFANPDAALFRTDPVRVRRISDRLDVLVDLALPAIAVGGDSVEHAIRLRLAPGGGEDAAPLGLASVAVVVEDGEGLRLDPSAVFASAALSAGETGSATTALFEEDRIVFSFDPPAVLAPADTLDLAGGLRIAESPGVSAFRIRLPLDEIRVAEGSPEIRGADGDTGANPSGYAHLAEKTFEGSLRNYPNPFASGREETTIAFYARGRGRVIVRIFTGLGIPVRHWEAPVDGAGLVETKWDGRNGDGRDVLSGVYLASIEVQYEGGSRDHGIHKIAVLR